MSKYFRVTIITSDDASLIGRYMLIFTRRRITVTDFSFSRMSEGKGVITIDFESELWAAENICKQLSKQIDILDSSLKELV